jgi:hypothetical protein
MISSSDLMVFLVAVAIVFGFFVFLRWFMSKADGEEPADHSDGSH